MAGSDFSRGRSGVRRTDLEVEGGGSMQDDVKARGLDSLVKGTLLGYIGHDGCVELVFAKVGVGAVNVVGLFLGADCGDDRVATREERFQYVG